MTTGPVNQADEMFELYPSHEDMLKTLAPYIIRSYTVDSTEWQNILNEHRSKLRRQYYKNKISRLLRGSIKSVPRVEGDYQQVWSLEMYPGSRLVDDSVTDLCWGKMGLRVRGWAEKRIHLLVLAGVINKLRPKYVLEVGSGNGVMSMMLAEMCPSDTRFHGLELTPNGIKKAKAVQELEDIPLGLVDFLPLPRINPGAFKLVDFKIGNAKMLPYGDSSIDLVFTSLALEQMRSIQSEALMEIARVCSGHALMIEPFPEFNRTREQFLYTQSKEYFSVPITELTAYGLHPVNKFEGLPCKVYRGAGVVLARVN